MMCPKCHGTGWAERVNWHGPYETLCNNCYESLGEVPDEDAVFIDENYNDDIRTMRDLRR